MKFLTVLMLMLPSALGAQVEFGFDSGMVIERSGGLKRTTFRVPSRFLRVGFPGERVSFETLLAFTHQKVGRQSGTSIEVIPGVSFYYGRGLYVRGEAGLFLTSGAVSRSQFAYGFAVGSRRRIGEGPLFFRLETGLTKWQESADYTASSNFRFLVGLSAVIGS